MHIGNYYIIIMDMNIAINFKYIFELTCVRKKKVVLHKCIR